MQNLDLSLFLFLVKEKDKGPSLPAFVARFYLKIKTTKIPTFVELLKPSLALLGIVNTIRVMCQSLKLGVYNIPNHCKSF